MTESKRGRRNKEQWKAIIEGHEASGLSIENYCKKHGVASSNFYTWRRKLNNQASQTQQQPEGHWVPITLESANASPGQWDIELELPGSVTLRMKSA